jgi:hypothetical protein
VGLHFIWVRTILKELVLSIIHVGIDIHVFLHLLESIRVIHILFVDTVIPQSCLLEFIETTVWHVIKVNLLRQIRVTHIINMIPNYYLLIYTQAYCY